MIFQTEDQLVLEVELHLRVHETADTATQGWLWFLLNIHTLFSVLIIAIIAKLDLLRSLSIKSAEIRIQVGTKQGKIFKICGRARRYMLNMCPFKCKVM